MSRPSASASALPRRSSTPPGRPSSARTALAPSATTVEGRPRSSSAASQCLQMSISPAVVQPPLAARLVLEVLDGVGEIDRLAVEASRRQRLVQHAPGGPDEGTARHVLAVARLLADEHDGSRHRPLAEYRLRRVAIERAPPARQRLGLHACQSGACRAHCRLSFPNAFLSSPLARSSTASRCRDSDEPARLMKNVSIDMAER